MDFAVFNRFGSIRCSALTRFTSAVNRIACHALCSSPTRYISLKIAYLLAVIFNRVGSLLALLLLSYILTPDAFGSYAMMMINALFVHTLGGSWLSMAATRQMALQGAGNDLASKSRLIVAAGYIILAECGLALLFASYHAITGRGVTYEELMAVLSLAIGLLLFDLTTAANNALGQDAAYLKANIIRNIGGSLMSISAALAGAAVPLIVCGQTAGILLALLLCRSSKDTWRQALRKARPAVLQWAHVLELFLFGIAGTLALGLLVCVNGLVRNFVLATDGAAASGVFALVGDIFNAPLVLLGTAFSLSKMRELYQSAQLPKRDQLHLHRQFVATICSMTIPYAVGGYLAAPAIASLIMPTESLALGSSIAGLSAAQSAALTIVSTSVTILLTGGEKRKTVLVVLITLLCLLSACLVGKQMGGGVYYARATLVGSVAACLISVLAIGFQAIPGRDLLRIICATIPMAIVVALLSPSDNPLWTIFIIIIGAGIYAAASFLLGIKSWRELIPARP